MTLFISDHEPCFFQHECSYNISVKSLTGKFRENVIYKIEGKQLKRINLVVSKN